MSREETQSTIQNLQKADLFLDSYSIFSLLRERKHKSKALHVSLTHDSSLAFNFQVHFLSNFSFSQSEWTEKVKASFKQ